MDERELVDVAAVEAVLQLLGERRFDSVPAGEDRLGRAIRTLADRLQRHALEGLNRTVSYSIALNEEVLAVVGLTRQTREISSRGAGITAATGALTQAVAEVAAASGETLEESRAAARAAVNGVDASAKTVATIEQIAATVADNAERVRGLAEGSGEIAVMARSVEAIARQTNMLALNAAIEAKRAGEHGRGFAVVADEVKKLATQTRRVAEDIGGRIESLRADLDAIVLRMEQNAAAVQGGRQVISAAGTEMQAVAERAGRTTELMARVADQVACQRDAAETIAADIADITTMTDSAHHGIQALTDVIDQSHKLIVQGLAKLSESDIPNKAIHLAMSDHMLWRKRLASMFIDRETLRDDEIGQTGACRFGRWYEAVAEPEIRNHPSFIKLAAPHARAHEIAVEVARLFRAGLIEDALTVMDTIQPCSVEILCHLGDLATSLDCSAVGAGVVETRELLQEVELF